MLFINKIPYPYSFYQNLTAMASKWREFKCFDYLYCSQLSCPAVVISYLLLLNSHINWSLKILRYYTYLYYLNFIKIIWWCQMSEILQSWPWSCMCLCLWSWRQFYLKRFNDLNSHVYANKECETERFLTPDGFWQLRTPQIKL